MRSCVHTVLVILLVCGAAAAAKEPSGIVLNWPENKPVVRITLGKFMRTSSVGNQQNWTVEVTAVNLWTKPLSATFALYAFDANKARVGDGTISLSSVAPQQTVKFAMFMQTIGVPTSVTLQPISLPVELRPLSPPRQVSLTIHSVPEGSSLKVDGKDAGMTPIAIKVTEGKHDLEFALTGYRTGHFPLVIAPDQLSGGTVTFELGGVSYDTVELRDGTVVNGDVQYVNATQVGVTVGGELHAYDRNLVKRILLVQREAPSDSPAPQPTTSAKP